MKEKQRLEDTDPNLGSPWVKWGPYLAERSWATVREDYSEDGDAWSFFPFEESHKKAYRWGEDGIAGWCDRYQVLSFAPAFWNGADPILKERYYGLGGLEGNHGEDVKEYYYYLDGVPSHSYMKCLYKYPQAAYPYKLLKEKSRSRSTLEREYELIDTGIFEKDAYFDIQIEYAKADEEDTCIRITAVNRGNASAPLHLLGQLWFRNQWAWGETRGPEPVIYSEGSCLIADDSAMPSPPSLSFDYHLGKRFFYATEGGEVLFTKNETGEKDAFHRFLIQKDASSLGEESGTKACFHYRLEIPSKKEAILYFRLSPRPLKDPLNGIEKVFEKRIKEADDFYRSIHPKEADEEEKRIQRQALAGMLWNKQFYFFDVDKWLNGDNPATPPPESRFQIRNFHWKHLNSMRILSVPDKWEYPWFAAWDLAFHCLTYAIVDLRFAKDQLWYLLFEQFQHPNGAIPAYEWNFSDLNPPVQAWVAYRLYEMEGKKDRKFLESCFFKMMLNFSFWVNQVDSSGCNVFEGGFLGLDNITILDRSEAVLENAIVKQSDGTGWMAMFSLNMMRIALELAKENSAYETIATKFFQHFVHIGAAMKARGNKKYSLWDEVDGFFYDTLVYDDGHFSPLRVRSLVGLIPLFAVDKIEKSELGHTPEFKEHLLWFMSNRSSMTSECVMEDDRFYFLSLVSQGQLTKILGYLTNEEEFLSSYGFRSLSKFHKKKPFHFKEAKIKYEPNESEEKIKGGNSNWRGPIWFPTNYLLIESLKKFGEFFPEIRTPIGSISEMVGIVSERMISLFKCDKKGEWPVFRDFPKEKDPHFRDLLLFYEYFNPETGKGLGSSHQTGWTGLVANLIAEFRNY